MTTDYQLPLGAVLAMNAIRERWCRLYLLIDQIARKSHDRICVIPGKGTLLAAVHNTNRCWAGLRALENLGLISVKEIGPRQTTQIAQHSYAEIDREELRFAIERAACHPPRSAWLFCDELELHTASPRFWSDVAPILGPSKKLIRPGYLQGQMFPAVLRGTTDPGNTHLSLEGVTSEASGCYLPTQHPLGLEVTPSRLQNRVLPAHVDISQCLTACSSEHGEAGQGRLSKGRWGSSKFPVRPFPKREKPPRPPKISSLSLDEIQESGGFSVGLPIDGMDHVEGGLHRQDRGAHKAFESDFNIETWEPWLYVKPELEAMFGPDCIRIESGLVNFTTEDPAPQRLLYEIKREHFKGKKEKAKGLQFEGFKAPIAAARVIRHYIRLLDIPADFRTVTWCTHIMRRMIVTDRRRVMAKDLLDLFAGAVHARLTAIKSGKLDYLKKFDLSEIVSLKCQVDYISAWKKTKLADPLAYLEGLPDGACCVKAADEEHAAATAAPADQDELKLILEDLEARREAMTFTYTGFNNLPVREQIRRALGDEDAELYDKLKETTDDLPVREVEDADDDRRGEEEEALG